MSIDLSKTQQYINWLSTKLYLDRNSSKSTKRIIKRGEIYWCHFGINIGSEMSKSSPRPCIIIQNDIANIHSGCTIVCPITHNSNNKPYLIKLPTYKDNDGNIILDGNVDTANIICISKARLGNKIISKKIDNAVMKTIDCAIGSQLGLIRYYKDIINKLNSKLKYIDKIKEDRNKSQDDLSNLYSLLNVVSFDEAKEKILKLLDK